MAELKLFCQRLELQMKVMRENIQTLRNDVETITMALVEHIDAD